MTINERLQIIVSNLGLTQAEFASSIGTTQATLSRQLKGVHKIDKQVALAIQAVHRIDHNWLLTGEGEMFLPTEQEKKPAEKKQINGLVTIEGNAPTWPEITDVDQIAHTTWFEKMPYDKQFIIAAIEDKDMDAESLADLVQFAEAVIKKNRAIKKVQAEVGIYKKGEAG
jgi:transcriptional regulator with XRE-family HTH domain